MSLSVFMFLNAAAKAFSATETHAAKEASSKTFLKAAG